MNGLPQNEPTSGVIEIYIIRFGQYYGVMWGYLVRLRLPPPLPERPDSVKLNLPDISTALMDPENVNFAAEEIIQPMFPSNLPPTEALPPQTARWGYKFSRYSQMLRQAPISIRLD